MVKFSKAVNNFTMIAHHPNANLELNGRKMVNVFTLSISIEHITITNTMGKEKKQIALA